MNQEATHAYHSVSQKFRFRRTGFFAHDLATLTSKFGPFVLLSGACGAIPKSFMLLAKFSSLWLKNWNSYFLAGCHPEATLRF